MRRVPHDPPLPWGAARDLPPAGPHDLPPQWYGDPLDLDYAVAAILHSDLAA